MKQRYKENIFSVNSPSQIPLTEFNKAMERNNFACIRGIVSYEEIEISLKLLASRFSKKNDHPGVGQSPDRVRTNFQTLKAGGESSSRSNNDARLFRAFYNPIWEEDIYNLRDVFIRLTHVRNVIAGLPLDFATTKIEPNGLWTAARVHQYPTGGGFFQKHTDYVASDITDKASTKFFQLILTMTTKGKDFRDGGAFIDHNDERIMLEDYFGPGDILVYDGRSVHGVEDIDPHLPLDLDTLNGRIAGLATLYKVIK